MANKVQKPNFLRPVGAAPQGPTEEEKQAMALRSFLQHRESLVQGILYNALHGGSGTRIDKDGNPDYKPAVKAAIEAADLLMEELYGKQFAPVAPAEEKKED